MKRTNVTWVAVVAMVAVCFGAAGTVFAGRLDFTNNRTVTNNADLTEAQSRLQLYTSFLVAGRNNGSWDGPNGIISSTATADFQNNGLETSGVGSLLNSDIMLSFAWDYALFGGLSVNDNSVLMKYTYLGDANLDGKVNGDDYLMIDMGGLFQDPGDPSTVNYGRGDFNYDGVINGDDYLAIDMGALFQGDPIHPEVVPGAAQPSSLVSAGRAGIAPVPEPSTFALLFFGLASGLFVWSRCRRCPNFG